MHRNILKILTPLNDKCMPLPESIHLPSTVPTFNSCPKYGGIPSRIHDRTPDCLPIFLGMDACMTSQLNVALIRMLRGPLKCLAYFLDMPFMVVCTARHWQTYGRRLQKLKVCTVFYLIFHFKAVLTIQFETIKHIVCLTFQGA